MKPIAFKFGTAGENKPSGNLYAGINVAGITTAESSVPSQSPATASTAENLKVSNEAAAKASEPTNTENQEPTTKSWSSALGFAPVQRRKAPSAKSAAKVVVPVGFSTVSIAPASQHAVSPSPAISAIPVVYSAEPQLTLDPSLSTRVPLNKQSLSNLPGNDDDVNGFLKSAAGQKATKSAKKNKRKKGAQNQPPDPARDFTAEYDPAKPNDYSEWKAYAKVKKEEDRQARRIAQRQREIEAAAALAGDVPKEDESEYSSESDSETERAKRLANKGRLFAPPTSYDDANDTAPNPDPPSLLPEANFAEVVDSVYAPSRTETGDEAYARRLAMSQQPPPPPPTPASSAPLPLPSQETGDEAYARRLTMSQQRQEPSSEPAIPGLGEIPYYTHSPSPVPPIQMNLGVSIEEAQAKARAIAAKLAKLGGGSSAPSSQSQSVSQTATVETLPPSVPVQSAIPTDFHGKRKRDVVDAGDERPNPQAFASRLMAKWGHKQGQGLGAQESGITKALHVQSGKSAKKEVAPGSAIPIGMSGGGRGVIISETKQQREQQEKARYGEPSRIVVLTNVVGRNEVDDDLPEEIAEQARKHGAIERCFVHSMPFNTPDEEAVRIFIVFSGLVGAWKALKEFDGRFFGGRSVRARFFDEVWVEREIYGMQFTTSV